MLFIHCLNFFCTFISLFILYRNRFDLFYQIIHFWSCPDRWVFQMFVEIFYQPETVKYFQGGIFLTKQIWMSRDNGTIFFNNFRSFLNCSTLCIILKPLLDVPYRFETLPNRTSMRVLNGMFYPLTHQTYDELIPTKQGNHLLPKFTESISYDLG